MYNTILERLNLRRRNISLWSEQQRETLWAWLEVGAIVVFAAWVASAYLDTSTTLWPAGGGWGTKLLGHHFWPMLQQCGLCALWNGSHDGGRPALADVFGSQFHPLVIITTLLWGVIGGAKIAIIGILAMLGIAQWWIARVLKLGRVARVWSALMGAAGGAIATMNNEGNFGLMLASASCGLAVAALLALAINQRRRDTVILAFMGALSLLAGQGYMQLALLAWAPATLFFWRRDGSGRTFYRELILAVVLAILIAGVILVPTAHFWPNFTKGTADPGFGFAEPLEYIPLNLLIRDRTFYISGTISGRQPFTDLQFIGWLPVLLALLSLRFVRRSNFAPLAFLACGAGLTYFVASAIPLRFLAPWIPFLYGFRFTSPIPALAVPAVLALAAFALDEIWKRDLPAIDIGATLSAKHASISLSLKWLVVLLLAVAVLQVSDFTKTFLALRDMHEIYQGLAVLQTLQTEWVAPPGGEVDFVEPAINLGLKITDVSYSGANWSGRDFPPPHLIVQRNSPPPNSVPAGDMLKIPLYRIAANEYAFIQTPDGQMTPCRAQASGGAITVQCDSSQPGQLVVREYAYSGWAAWLDHQPQAPPSPAGPWLTLNAPAGQHLYEFRYLPWDVPVGLVVSLLGLGLAVFLLFERRPAIRTASGSSSTT